MIQEPCRRTLVTVSWASRTTRSAAPPTTNPPSGKRNALAGLTDDWRTAASSASSRGSPLLIDGVSEDLVHGGGAAGDGVGAGDLGDAVDDVDGQGAEPVGAVGHTGGGHRVGDQRDPVRPDAAADLPVQGGVQVHPVGDQFHGHPGVLHQRDHRSGFAVVHRPHRVEQVGGDTVAPASIAARACA